MIAYLFELGYHLALSQSHNVLQSPGFDACGLIFNKKDLRACWGIVLRLRVGVKGDYRGEGEHLVIREYIF